MSGGTTEHPARARRQIDAMLTASGWDVQDRKNSWGSWGGVVTPFLASINEPSRPFGDAPG